MAVRLSPIKADFDSRSGNLALTLRNLFEEIQQFWTTLTSVTDAQLITLGYTQDDVDNLRAAYADLNGLAQIFQGQEITTGYGTAVGTGTYNFGTFTKLLTGVF